MRAVSLRVWSCAFVVALATALPGPVVPAAAAGPAGPRHHTALELRAVTAKDSAVVPTGNPAHLTDDDLGRLGVTEAGGIAEEPDGTVHVLDTTSNAVVVAPARDLANAESVPLDGLGAGAVGAIAYNRADGRLYAVDSAGTTVYRLNDAGAVTDTYAITDPTLSPVSEMTFAPTSDGTDAADATSLYLGADTRSGPAVAEVSLAQADALLTPTATAALLHSVPTSAYSPPSPDASDVAYVPAEDRLLLGDSEVEEMAIFAGVNIWRADRSGTPTGTGSTMTYSAEPSGLAYDADRDVMLVADDDTESVYTVTRGGDGAFGTADDGVTSFKVTVPGLHPDPEGIAVDPTTDQLFIADGVNSEVYRTTYAGTLTGHWDVGQYGSVVAEGIVYDASRDLLLLVDDTCRVYELTTDGELVDVVDISAARCRHSAGIALAPASSGNGEQSMYIVDRGVDNDINPDENDGLLQELSSPTLPLVGNKAPVVSAGTDQTVTFPAAANLSATASDDGNPNPPGTIARQWSKVSGPGSVTFTDATELATRATFGQPGTYVLRFEADDGDVTSYDKVTVVANERPTVAAGPDQLVTLPAAATLSGTATDDGLPAPATLTTRWSKVSGPGNVTFGDATTPGTSASFSEAGVYILRLTATDGAASTTDEITVTANDRPTDTAGPDTSVVLPTSTARTEVRTGPDLAVHAVPASRILKARLGAGSTLTVQVQGRGGLPAADVRAAILNLSVTGAKARGFLTMWPSDLDRPAARTLRFARATPADTLVQTSVGADGRVRIFNGAKAPVRVLADVNAWLAHAEPGETGGLFNPVQPHQVLDTRATGGPIRPGAARTVRVTGAGGVPGGGVAAAVLSVVAHQPTRDGHLTVYPADRARPAASAVSFTVGASAANRVVVPVSAAGAVKIFNSAGATHVVVRVVGWVSASGPGGHGALYAAKTPVRLADSRSGYGGLGPFTAAGTRTLQVTGHAGIPSASSPRRPSAVVLAVTAVNRQRGGGLTVFPADASSRPRPADLWFGARQPVSQLVVIRLSDGGQVKLHSTAGGTNVRVDVLGWYAD